jgi:signal transduction histidine kinase
MYLRSRLQQSPFLLLFKLELVLLSIVICTVIGMMLIHPTGPLATSNSLIAAIAALLAFAAIGLFVPAQPRSKILYLCIEFLLIFTIFIGTNLPLFQLLFIVLIIRNCGFLRGRARTITTGFSCIGYIVCQVERLRHPLFPVTARPEQLWIFGLGSMLTFGLVVLFLQLLVDAVLNEQESQQELAIAHAQLQQYALQVEDLATVQERNRIARDIHDSLGHSLSIFNLHLAAALRLFHQQPTAAEALLREVQAVGQQALQDVSHSVATLRADPLNGQPLYLAILSLVEQAELSMGVRPSFTWMQGEQRSPIDRSQPDPLTPLHLSNTQKMTIYRIIQESLTNIRKYSGATDVMITIAPNHTQLTVSIVDNGRGFTPTDQTSGFGLQGMRERLAVLSGHLEINSAPNQGCHIIATFPIAAPFSATAL